VFCLTITDIEVYLKDKFEVSFVAKNLRIPFPLVFKLLNQRLLTCGMRTPGGGVHDCLG
jgi:hypothetical protein